MKSKSSQPIDPLDEIKFQMRSGRRRFFIRGSDPDTDLLSFWKWSGSNLLINTVRGVLAEFLVVSSLDLVKEPRNNWDSYDIRLESGVKIEVKSAARYQAWKQKKPSPIKFGIPKRKSWNSDTGESAKEASRSADIYVFCKLNDIEPMNLDNWEFYVLLTECINESYGDQKTVSLKSLKRQFPELKERLKLRFDQLDCAIKEAEEHVLLRRKNQTETT